MNRILLPSVRGERFAYHVKELCSCGYWVHAGNHDAVRAQLKRHGACHVRLRRFTSAVRAERGHGEFGNAT